MIMRTQSQNSVTGTGGVLFDHDGYFKITRSRFVSIQNSRTPLELAGWVEMLEPFSAMEAFFGRLEKGKRRTGQCRITVERSHGATIEMTAELVVDRTVMAMLSCPRMMVENIVIISGPWW